MPPRPGLREAWVGLLDGHDWDHFITLTFASAASNPRAQVHPDYAHRSFDSFISRLERRAHRPVAWFRGDELGPQTGRLHFHALLQGTSGLLHRTVAECWPQGHAWVRRYDPELGAAHYVTKYVTKERADYNLSRRLVPRGSDLRLW